MNYVVALTHFKKTRNIHSLIAFKKNNIYAGAISSSGALWIKLCLFNRRILLPKYVVLSVCWRSFQMVEEYFVHLTLKLPATVRNLARHAEKRNRHQLCWYAFYLDRIIFPTGQVCRFCCNAWCSKSTIFAILPVSIIGIFLLKRGASVIWSLSFATMSLLWGGNLVKWPHTRDGL